MADRHDPEYLIPDSVDHPEPADGHESPLIEILRDVVNTVLYHIPEIIMIALALWCLSIGIGFSCAVLLAMGAGHYGHRGSTGGDIIVGCFILYGLWVSPILLIGAAIYGNCYLAGCFNSYRPGSG